MSFLVLYKLLKFKYYFVDMLHDKILVAFILRNSLYIYIIHYRNKQSWHTNITSENLIYFLSSDFKQILHKTKGKTFQIHVDSSIYLSTFMKKRLLSGDFNLQYIVQMLLLLTCKWSLSISPERAGKKKKKKRDNNCSPMYYKLWPKK